MYRKIAAACAGFVLVLAPSIALASFNTDLGYGATGSDVLSLQQFLVTQGLLSADSATGNFLSLTRAAVQSFQTRQGITPASGFFGPLTRAKINAMAGGTSSAPQSSVPGNSDTGTSVTNTDPAVSALLAEIQQLEARLQALRSGQPIDNGIPNGNTSSGIMCPAIAKQCPDGSYVSPSGPSCSYTCPTTPSTPSNICPAVAKQCSDGTYVSPSGPNCSYTCPTSPSTPINSNCAVSSNGQTTCWSNSNNTSPNSVGGTTGGYTSSNQTQSCTLPPTPAIGCTGSATLEFVPSGTTYSTNGTCNGSWQCVTGL